MIELLAALTILVAPSAILLISWHCFEIYKYKKQCDEIGNKIFNVYENFYNLYNEFLAINSHKIPKSLLKDYKNLLSDFQNFELIAKNENFGNNNYQLLLNLYSTIVGKFENLQINSKNFKKRLKKHFNCYATKQLKCLSEKLSNYTTIKLYN